MSSKTSYFKIGIFVICAVAVGVIALIVLGADVLFQKRLFMETYFKESVQGLDIGSPLKFRGFRIGRIEEIALVGKEYHTDHRYILVRSSIPLDEFRMKSKLMRESDMQLEVTQGLRSRLGFQGLTGSAYLELDYVDPKRYPQVEIDWTPKNLYIPSVPGTIARLNEALDRIMRQAETLNFEQFADSIQKTFQTVTDSLESMNVKKVAEQIGNLIAEVGRTNKRLDKIIEGIDVKPLLGNASAAMASAKRIFEKTEKPLEELIPALTETAVKMKGLVKNLDSLAKNVPDNLDSLKRTLRRLDILVVNQQQNVEEIMENFKIFSQDLREMGENAKQYPAQVLFGKPPAPIDKKKKK